MADWKAVWRYHLRHSGFCRADLWLCSQVYYLVLVVLYIIIKLATTEILYRGCYEVVG